MTHNSDTTVSVEDNSEEDFIKKSTGRITNSIG